MIANKKTYTGQKTAPKQITIRYTKNTHLGELGLHALFQPADTVVLLDQLRREAGHLVPRVVVGGSVAVPPRQGPVAAAPRPAAV